MIGGINNNATQEGVSVSGDLPDNAIGVETSISGGFEVTDNLDDAWAAGGGNPFTNTTGGAGAFHSP